MIEKQQPIVALGHSSKPKKARPPRNNLLLSLKKNDLEMNFYSSLDTEIMNKSLMELGGFRELFAKGRFDLYH